MKEKHLLLFTIGPVQSFIAQARKTRDLFGASKLLTHLIRFLIDGITREGGEIIFPAAPDSDSLPNRFIAEWFGESTEMEALAKSLEQGLCDHWLSIGQEVFERHGLQWRNAEQQQMRNHLEIFWLAIPEQDKYPTRFALLENRMGARKNVREFSQLNNASNLDFGEVGRKCSLDGTYNALVIRPVNERGNRNAQLLRNSTSIQKHEGLSAVSFTKRNYLHQAFKSTAAIAFSDTIQQLKKTIPAIAKDIDFINRMDEQIWGEPQLNANVFERILEDIDPALADKLDKKDLQKKWTSVKDLAKKHKLRFTKYYAVLQFDGDNMGKWLSGDKNYLKPEIELKAFHQAFSKSLSEFAKRVEEIISEGPSPAGQCVYAGGDDFLGLINLNHLLPLLVKLRQEFRQLVHLPLAETYLQPNQELSFSAGVCIAAIKEPLRVVLEYSRHLEKEAKRRFKTTGKDAIAIGFIKGSGELRETYWPQYLDQTSPSKLTASNFIRIFQLLASGRFSEDFIRTLDREMQTLGIPTEDIAVAEISRLVYRKYIGHPQDSDTIKTAYCEELKELLLELYKQMPRSWENFLSALYMCSFLKDKLNYQFHHDSL